MARYWSDQQLDHITPPQVNDIRGRAFLRTLDQMIAAHPLRGFFVRDALTCPSKALPALIAEYSLEEFIAPGLPEHVVRRIVANAWFLHEGKGYDDGVMLGLNLLGMSGDIKHWYQETPMAAANTHVITFGVDELLFGDGDGRFDQRQIRAAKKMIDATKRWSQGSEIRAGVITDIPLYHGIFPITQIVAEARPNVPAPPVLDPSAKYAVIPTTQIRAIAHPN